MVTEKRRRGQRGRGRDQRPSRRGPPHPLTIVKAILGDEDCILRWSRKGTPHLVYTTEDGDKVSICWFGSRATWKTFEPWPGFVDGERIEQDVKEWPADKVLDMLSHVMGPGSQITL